MGLTVRLSQQLLGLPAGFEGQDVNGPESLEPALTLASAGFWGSLVARMSWPEVKVKEGRFSGASPALWVGPSSQLVCFVAQAVPMDKRDRQTESYCTRSFLCVVVGLVHLSISSYKGTAAMAFGQVQGREGVPPTSPRH